MNASARPPPTKTALGQAFAPSAAADIEPPIQRKFSGTHKPSRDAKQACRALIRDDIAAALHLAADNAALALDYLDCGDDAAADYLIRRLRAYAQFASECALELRELAA
jgi:hypothetical protein